MGFGGGGLGFHGAEGFMEFKVSWSLRLRPLNLNSETVYGCISKIRRPNPHLKPPFLTVCRDRNDVVQGQK